MKSVEALGGGINKAKYLKNESNNRKSERKTAFGVCLPALHEGGRRPNWLGSLPMHQLYIFLIFYLPSPRNTSRQPETLTLQHPPWSCLSEWFLPFQSQCPIWTLLSLLTCQICLPTSPQFMRTLFFSCLCCLYVSQLNSVPRFVDHTGLLGLSENFIHLQIDKFPLVSYGWTYSIKWPPSPAICQPGFWGYQWVSFNPT